MPEKRYRAPEHYGAWAEGRYYNPGQLLPAGVQDILVSDIEYVEAAGDYRTYKVIVHPSISLEDLEAELAEGWEWMEQFGYPKH